MVETIKKISEDVIEVTNVASVSKTTLLDQKAQLEAQIAKEKGEVDNKYQKHLDRMNSLLAEWD